jgi:Tat protein translocase TatB subunit
MGIGNIGWSEFLVVLALALIFFGPHRLPAIAQAIGRSLREFQKALNEVKSEFAEASRQADTREDLKRIAPRPAQVWQKLQAEVTREAEAERPPPAPDTVSGAPPRAVTGSTPNQGAAADADAGDPDLPTV